MLPAEQPFKKCGSHLRDGNHWLKYKCFALEPVNNFFFMKKKILSFLILMFALATMFSFFLIPTSAQDYDPTLKGLNDSAQKVTAFDTNGDYTNFIQTRAGIIVGVVLSFVGVLFLGLMIYAGILWMTAQGNDQQVTKAKTLMINSVIGLIIVFAAYAITSFVGNNFLG